MIQGNGKKLKKMAKRIIRIAFKVSDSKKKKKDEKKLGTPMPKDKLRDWIAEKRKKYLKSQEKRGE